MKVTRLWMLLPLSLLAFVTALLFASEHRRDPPPGKVVLHLPYRNGSDKHLAKPYTFGMFDWEEESYFANFVGTDWDGNIYIMDPIEPDVCVLKRFDRQGYFQEVWKPIRARASNGIAVTKDGYIWLGLRWVVSDRLNGLPIVVYQKGKKEPAIDWRSKLPQEVESRIRAVLKEAGLEWKKWTEVPRYDLATNDWHVLGAQSEREQVAVRFSARFMGSERRYVRILWILMQNDGSRIIDVRLGTEKIPHLAPDGSFWLRESDFEVDRWTWSKVWWWKKEEGKGEPLIDRTQNKEPWADTITLGKATPPKIEMDAKGHIFLVFNRDTMTTQERRYLVEGKVVDTVPAGSPATEQALIVLDKESKVVSYLPWHLGIDTIKPLPDGSGFYRIQFLEKEAVVYFHPLPK
jgi:hypothetical protein